MRMKISLFGLPGIPLGKHNLKDARLDQADQLVEAQKKTYAQVEVVEEKEMLTADAILTSRAALSDLLMKDLEFVETRLGRDANDAEKAVLNKLAETLISEKPVSSASLGPEELAAISAHNFYSSKPVVVAEEAELADTAALLVRAFKESGYISFLTVGGKENRAWPLRAGLTAWEAAGTIHTDIQKGFIRAEIISFADFIAAGGETEAKRAGKQRLELKTYVMQDFDLTNFRFNK
jgi:ribosome-binding ATPase YchF (GTP1/OBG family)